MKRNNIITDPARNKANELKQRIIFHEAAHATAIYLNNKARNLPHVFFQINFKGFKYASDFDVQAYQPRYEECLAKVEGGRLIESLPPSIDGLACFHRQTAPAEQLIKDFILAAETDIVNLLIGPLAEAKFVAETDNELFNHRLVNIGALKNYGGSSDLAVVNEYLQIFYPGKRQQDEKLAELFMQAFEFIDDYSNWKAVTELAVYILECNKNIISCEEVIAVLEKPEVQAGNYVALSLSPFSSPAL